MKQVVVFDLDNTLVDFRQGFTKEANRLFGTPIFSCDTQESYDLHTAMGISEEQAEQVWDACMQNDRYWMDLKPAIGINVLVAIEQLCATRDVYFATMREGIRPKKQSEIWLRNHGIGHPSVIIVRGNGAKGDLCSSIGATHILDDHYEFLSSVRKKSPDTKAVLLNRGYNINKEIHEGIVRVNSVSEFLQDVFREHKSS